jgi:hypothetical protein
VTSGKYLRSFSIFAFAVTTLSAADGAKADADRTTVTAAASARAALPPVLRNNEPADSRFVLLPGPAVKAAAIATRSFVPPPAAKPAATVETAERLEPAPPELIDPGRPVLHRAPRPIYPSEFEKDSGLFCQKQIGQWKQADALNLLGVPSADRPAYDDSQAVNGRIYAFSDPTNRYRQLELDFDSATGALRTVFAYPWKMTWMECRRVFGANVSATEANKGRKFYSYLNRRLDVLVDATGKVISIGLY